MSDFETWWAESNINTPQLRQECENLLKNSTYDCESISIIEQELWYYEEEKLNELKANLLNHQIDHIQNGLNYTQKDIQNKLNQII